MSTTIAPATLETANPATGEHLASYPAFSRAEIDARLASAAAAAQRWREVPVQERAALVRRVGAHLRDHAPAIARLASLEMGKPLAEAEAEVRKSALGCDYYADYGPSFLTHVAAPSTATRSYVAYRPIGAVLAIMPWNFPFWQVFRFAAPALVAGNVGVLKHAANVTACALEIERMFTACGAPEGVFSTLVVPGREMDAVIADRRIAAVTLTGSEGAGSAVAATAGKFLKKTVLELGGSDAFIVLDDADVEAAAQTAARSRFQNCGQSCIAAKRFIVTPGIAGAFTDAFAAAARALRVGDPFDPAVTMGPLARPEFRDDLERQVAATLARGARIVVGGHRVEGRGSFFEPTILDGVEPGMAAFDEETFGPVAAIVHARDTEHAVELANASPYGLGGNLWTRDIERAETIAARLESGGVFINGMTASDPRLPFGGVKRSGYGRELSAIGMHEFTNVQTVWIGPPAP